MGGGLFLALRVIVVILYVLVIARVLISWIDPRFQGQAARLVYRLTEPFLRPIRDLLPRTGMIDFSPMIALVALTILAAAVGLR